MTRIQALVFLHILVFIWGFTGILGKEISLDAFQLVWWRVVKACAAMGLFALITRKSLRSTTGEVLQFMGVGVFTAAHWICFFWAIKVSNVSTALAVISTISFFVALLGPLIRKTRFHFYEIVLGLLVILGLVIIFKFEPEYKLGIILSLICSVCAAVFSSFNSVLVKKHEPTKIAFYEMLSGITVLSIFLAFQGKLDFQLLEISSRDFILLLVLGVVCTAFAFVFAIELMKQLSPFTCAIAVNMEPVYTILLALWIYGESEFMSVQFYVGALLIIATIFLEAWLKRKEILQ